MKNITLKISLFILSGLLLGSCLGNKEERNQVKMAGVWEITKIKSDQYANKELISSTTFEGDKLGEITLLNLSINDFNSCYMRISKTATTAFESNFKEISNADTNSRYYASQWGTTPSSLQYINFYEIDVEAVNAKSWTASIEKPKSSKQVWVYTHFNSSNQLTYIEEIHLKKQ